MSGKKMRIKVTKNGPYIVSEDIPLDQAIIEPDEDGKSKEWGKGRKYDTQGKQYALCRCGHSKNKPFCDGAHEEIGFDGEETADNIPYLESVKEYRGENIVLLDKESLCTVARFCDRFAGVWQMTIESGQNPEYEELATDEARKCPGGRLTMVKDGELIEPKLNKEVSIIEDKPSDRKGPIWVKGGIPVEGADGTEYEVRNRVALCRCGESSNKPFCDATHMRCNHTKGLDD